MSRNRRQRPTPPRATPLITTTEARDLAADLIRELAQHAGDPAGVRAVLLRWLAMEDADRLALVCLSLTWQVFSEWLTPVPVDEIEPGSLTLTTPERNTA